VGSLLFGLVPVATPPAGSGRQQITENDVLCVTDYPLLRRSVALTGNSPHSTAQRQPPAGEDPIIRHDRNSKQRR